MTIHNQDGSSLFLQHRLLGHINASKPASRPTQMTGAEEQILGIVQDHDLRGRPLDWNAIRAIQPDEGFRSLPGATSHTPQPQFSWLPLQHGMCENEGDEDMSQLRKGKREQKKGSLVEKGGRIEEVDSGRDNHSNQRELSFLNQPKEQMGRPRVHFSMDEDNPWASTDPSKLHVPGCQSCNVRGLPCSKATSGTACKRCKRLKEKCSVSSGRMTTTDPKRLKKVAGKGAVRKLVVPRKSKTTRPLPSTSTTQPSTNAWEHMEARSSPSPVAGSKRQRVLPAIAHRSELATISLEVPRKW